MPLTRPAQHLRAQAVDPSAEAAAVIRDCDQKLTRYRALIDSGAADSATVAQWISETEARRAAAAARRPSRKPRVLPREKIARIVDAVGNMAEALRNADNGQKNRLYRALGVRMTYEPVQRKMLVEIAPDQHSVGEWVVSEGGLEPPRPIKGTSTSS